MLFRSGIAPGAIGVLPELYYAAPPASSFGSGGLYDIIADAGNNRIFVLDLTDNAIIEYDVSVRGTWTQTGSFQSLIRCSTPYSATMNPAGTRLYVCTYGNTSVTASSSTDKVTLTAHGLVDGNAVWFGGTPPSPLVAGTKYFVRDSTANDFKVAATSGGTAIDLTTNGSSVKLTSRGFSIFDISVPGTITFVGRLDSSTLSDTRDVAYIDATHLAITDGSSGLAIADLTTESAPTLSVAASTYSGAIGGCRACDYYAAGKLLAVASRTNTAIVIFDLSTIGTPVVAGSVTDATAFKFVSEAIWKSDGSRIFTLSTGTRNNPSLGGDCVAIVDASTPSSPSLISYIQSHTVLSGARRAVMSADEKTMYSSNNSRDSFVATSFANENQIRVVAEAYVLPHVTEASSPTGSRYGAAHGVARIGTRLFGGGDLPNWGWRVELDLAQFS